MRRSPGRAFVTTFVLAILASTLPQAQNVRENVRDAERLVKVRAARAMCRRGARKTGITASRRPR